MKMVNLITLTENLIVLILVLAPFIPAIYKKYTNTYTFVGITICFVGLFIVLRGLLAGFFGGPPNTMEITVGFLIYAIGFILQILKG